MIGAFICWLKGHLDGSPAFELPPIDETNREINSRLLIYRCPRCGGDYIQFKGGDA
jgi:Zn finger protein HypA/HybF involved in hydrogenase expression